VIHAAWIIGVTAAVVYRVGRFGFNPTDQGFILAQSWRLWQGEIPHVDIVSARPLGTSVIHMLDFLLPGPRYLSSITLAAFEMVLTAVVCAALATGRPIRSWGLLLTGAVAASALIDVGTNPIMPWHTVDGALFSVCGWWLTDRGLATDRPWPIRTGLFLLGVAVLCKQSFAPAALIGVIMLFAHPATRGRRRIVHRTVLDLVALLAFPFGYLAVVVAAGGWGDAVRQLLGATAVYDQRLFDALPAHPRLLAVAVAAAGLAATRSYKRLRWLDAALSVAILAAVGNELVTGRLVLAADWTVILWWIALLVTVADGAARRHVPWRPLAVVVLAALVSLSWGADSPTLVAGALALTTVYLLVVGHRDAFGVPHTTYRPAVVVGVVLLVGGAGLGVVIAHDHGPYRDAPQARLTVNLGTVIPALDGIYTNASTGKYLGQLVSCIRDHPAPNVAVFPDDPFIYPAMRLHDPFPLDWPLPMELVGDARQRMLTTMARLNRDGHYLVLFQTVDSLALGRESAVPDNVTPTAPIVTESGIEPFILNGLHGQRITCGSLVGVYSR
jgi:hypothetical protein